MRQKEYEINNLVKKSKNRIAGVNMIQKDCLGRVKNKLA